VKEGRITDISDVPLTSKDCPQAIFFNALIFPGLINSHDHLDFNLFPKLGTRKYANYTEWGRHIHEAYAAEIAAVQKIPQPLREQWGIYKNLLCGVTTVVNHGEHRVTGDKLISVFEATQDLHSVQFEPHWKKRLNNPLKMHLPVVIHTGEGTDATARHEIEQLINWNLLHRKLVGIHGVALTPALAKSFEALVWCPQSNYFLLGTTAPVQHLKKHVRILFGTDSTLTGDWDIWEHIRAARGTGMLKDDELYDALTLSAAKTWKLNCGRIGEGLDADMVIVKGKADKSPMESFYSTKAEDILMVMHRGNIRLFDQSLYHQLTDMPLKQFGKLYVGNSIKYVEGDVQRLMAEIRQYKADTQFPVYHPSEPAA
jgi:cytosine/adenosine deaminase-related metal-dependent hydrolase